MPEAVPIAVHLLPTLIPLGALRGGIAVVLDVLRASTMIVHALAAGCDAVLPCLEVDDARRLARSLAPGSSLLGGERHGVPIEGFDLGNSPRSCTPERCRGKSLCFTTTNGTRAILATLEAERVVVCSFANFGATLGLLCDDGRPVHVVCSGTEGEISLEDTLLAGALVHALSREQAGMPSNDPAKIAEQAWQTRLRDDRPLADLLALGRGGRRVTELGLRDDIEAAADLDRFPLGAELDRGNVSGAAQTGTPHPTLPHKGGGEILLTDERWWRSTLPHKGGGDAPFHKGEGDAPSHMGGGDSPFHMGGGGSPFHMGGGDAPFHKGEGNRPATDKWGGDWPSPLRIVARR